MKRTRLTTFAIFIVIISCKQSGSNFEASPGTPASLQEDSKSGIGFSKRVPEGLVENLYAELLEKNADLNELEKVIETLDDQTRDSVYAFNQFDKKNTSYYISAKSYSATIKDSLLRMKMEALIDNSLKAYDRSIAPNENLISMMNTKSKSLGDLHIVLKLVKTLPIIGKYQSENRPSVTPVENVIGHFDKAIKQADTLARE